MGKVITDTKNLIFPALLIFGMFNNCSGREQLSKSQTYNDITVSVVSSFEQDRHHGYAEHKITLQNASADKIHIVTLFAPNSSYSRNSRIHEISKTIAVAPSAEITVSLFQPAINIYGDNLGVIIDNKTQEKGVGLKFSDIDSVYHQISRRFPEKKTDAPLRILLSRNVSYDSFKETPLKPKGLKKNSVDMPESVKDRFYEFLSADSTIESWSENWLAYTPYDGIVVAADEMQSMPKNIESAILKYIRCGGSLLVLGKWDGAKQWQNAQESSDPLKLHYIDFGVCVVSETNNVASWHEQTWKKLNDIAWQPTGKELLRYRDIATANDELAVVDTLAIPVRGLFILVIVFAIAIGPVNLLVLHKLKKRIWMLWTVPLIAILTSLVVFSYALYTEGFHSNSRIRSITILNQKLDTATTIGLDGFYCPLTPSGGLRYDIQTELTPLGFDQYRGRRTRTIDWTSDQHLESGWIAGRIPTHFLLRKSQAAVKSVKIEANKQNMLYAENYFGAPIESLWYADKNGIIYSAQNIPTAAKTELTQTQLVVSQNNEKPAVWRDIYSSNWTEAYNNIIAQPQNFLMPGTYIAVFGSSPFVEQPLEKIKIQKLETVVFGILEGF